MPEPVGGSLSTLLGPVAVAGGEVNIEETEIRKAKKEERRSCARIEIFRSRRP